MSDYLLISDTGIDINVSLNSFGLLSFSGAIRRSCKSRNSCNSTTFPYGKIVCYNFSVHAEIVHEKFVLYGNLPRKKCNTPE